jgi:hypothetical protein
MALSKKSRHALRRLAGKKHVHFQTAYYIRLPPGLWRVDVGFGKTKAGCRTFPRHHAHSMASESDEPQSCASYRFFAYFHLMIQGCALAVSPNVPKIQNQGKCSSSSAMLGGMDNASSDL